MCSITEPACGYYRCVVTWPVGSKVAVNWLGPPPGNVRVSLESNIGGPSYLITSSIPANSQEGYCDSGYGMGVIAQGHECGRVEFVVPEKWQRLNNYTIVVQSLSDESLIGYTDMITIADYNASSPSAVPAKQVPAGTSVSLLTIPGPTSVNKGASTRYTGVYPSPTAVTAQTTTSTPPVAAETTSSLLPSSIVRLSSSSLLTSSSSAAAANASVAAQTGLAAVNSTVSSPSSGASGASSTGTPGAGNGAVSISAQTLTGAAALVAAALALVA
ncbi:hypothetical protein Rhopal_006973-T1 [Rhodotorula paludigena]|uniref:Uncharacterized protein n=1 Tax=Rhodotorula paludigena TaxID=86838 RepID=A0AAV5GVD9_9BASI|nr:hypothetical protein Rhopal_006973-T1 [Rhodotorula paludigena]